MVHSTAPSLRPLPPALSLRHARVWQALRAAVKDALLLEAVYRGEVTSADAFIAAGAKIRCQSITPPSTALPGAAKVRCGLGGGHLD